MENSIIRGYLYSSNTSPIFKDHIERRDISLPYPVHYFLALPKNVGEGGKVT